ncbi:MAG: HEAT repeat domain-containing protein, partial [Deltaproteobacteria bacterium]|nr:HEAT repeat domain-containing protein [Deltaproteobacteria bacterium]
VFLPALQKAVLSDGDANVRADVVAVLGKAMALPGVAALLRTVAEKDASPDVRRSAQALLASSR